MALRSRRPRRFFVRLGILSSVIFVILVYTFTTPQPWRFSSARRRAYAGPRMPASTPLPPLDARIPCIGPRGQLLSTSSDDDLEVADLDIPYPVPAFGSYDELNLSRNWMTPSGRYGAYGHGENAPYDRLRVGWDTIDWSFLQQECFKKNIGRFSHTPEAPFFDVSPRFTLRNKSSLQDLNPPWNAFNRTRRTAVILSVDGDETLGPSDLHHIRSVIVETGLQSGGEHTVLLLVRVHSGATEPSIISTVDTYHTALNRLQLPDEFRSIALLWDDQLLQSWYPLVAENETAQTYQLLQLLALHYPEFDHFWHIDRDVRITCDAGELLDSLDVFARAEPRKQALERTSFRHMQRHLSTYASFSTAVNSSNGGSSHAWGPLNTFPRNAVSPIGPEPPVLNPEEDAFQWGVGEDADIIVTASCSRLQDKLSDHRPGFWSLGHRAADAPRWTCPPAALQRASRSLLLASHAAQLATGLALPNDAMLPTLTLWHGLKLSAPPLPTFVRMKTPSGKEKEVARLLDASWGGGPGMSSDGFGTIDSNETYGGSLSWWWSGDFPDELMKAWYLADGNQGVPPQPLVGRGGEVYMPAMVLYPVKWRNDEG